MRQIGNFVLLIVGFRRLAEADMSCLADFSYILQGGLLALLLIIRKEHPIFNVGVTALEEDFSVTCIPHSFLHPLLHLPADLTHLPRHALWFFTGRLTIIPQGKLIPLRDVFLLAESSSPQHLHLQIRGLNHVNLPLDSFTLIYPLLPGVTLSLSPRMIRVLSAPCASLDDDLIHAGPLYIKSHASLSE